jgi:hypothetical protein
MLISRIFRYLPSFKVRKITILLCYEAYRMILVSKATLDANLKALAIKNNRTLLGIE